MASPIDYCLLDGSQGEVCAERIVCLPLPKLPDIGQLCDTSTRICTGQDENSCPFLWIAISVMVVIICIFTLYFYNGIRNCICQAVIRRKKLQQRQIESDPDLCPADSSPGPGPQDNPSLKPPPPLKGVEMGERKGTEVPSPVAVRKNILPLIRGHETDIAAPETGNVEENQPLQDVKSQPEPMAVAAAEIPGSIPDTVAPEKQAEESGDQTER